MSNTLFFDSTLRDGSHAIKHQLTKQNIADYCKGIDQVGMEVVIVGHGNGLGASSLQVGRSLLKDNEMIEIARKNLNSTKLGIFLISGFGTIKDDLMPAIDQGVDLACVASHCTEADITSQHIDYVRSRGKEAYGVLMMYHMTTKERLLEEANKMKSYGAQGVILMDSAGASTPEMVSDTVKHLTSNLDIKIGFHAHNNLGLAVSNSYLAMKNGASIVDGTLCGFGGGVGNCALEVLAALLQKSKIESTLDLYKLFDVCEKIMPTIMTQPQVITTTHIISGLAGVFSAFVKHVKIAALRYGVDERDIFIELGNRKVVGGQEDIIVEIANQIKNKKLNTQKSLDYNLNENRI